MPAAQPMRHYYHRDPILPAAHDEVNKAALGTGAHVFTLDKRTFGYEQKVVVNDGKILGSHVATLPATTTILQHLWQRPSGGNVERSEVGEAVQANVKREVRRVGSRMYTRVDVKPLHERDKVPNVTHYVPFSKPEASKWAVTLKEKLHDNEGEVHNHEPTNTLVLALRGVPVGRVLATIPQNKRLEFVRA